MPISSVVVKAKSDVQRYDIEEIKQLVREVSELEVPSSYNKKRHISLLRKMLIRKRQKNFFRT